MDPRSCGIAESRSAALLTGAYQGRAGISDRLLNALPDLLVVTDDEGCSRWWRRRSYGTGQASRPCWTGCST